LIRLIKVSKFAAYSVF